MVDIGDIYALTSAATFAVSSAIMKYLNPLGSAAKLNFVRVLIGAIIFVVQLILLGLIGDLFSISLLILLYLALSVIFNVVIGDTSFFEAQNQLGVKIATPLANTFPFLTVVLAVIFLGEEITPKLIIGSVLLIPGVILLSLDKIDPSEEKGEGNRKKGLLLIFIAVVSYALGVIFTTVGTVDMSPVVANSVRLPIATISLIGLVAFTADNGSWSDFGQKITHSSLSTKFLILLAGVFGTYFSSFFLVRAVQEIGASRSAILFSTGPFFALPVALIWLRERIGWMTILGTVMTVVGLWYILG